MPVDKASDGAELRKLIAQLRPETVRACNAVFVLYGDRRPRPKEIIEIADVAGARHEPVCAVFGYVRHCLAKTLIWESVHGPPANGRSVMAYLDDRDREWAIAFAIHDGLWPHRLKIIRSDASPSPPRRSRT